MMEIEKIKEQQQHTHTAIQSKWVVEKFLIYFDRRHRETKLFNTSSFLFNMKIFLFWFPNVFLQLISAFVKPNLFVTAKTCDDNEIAIRRLPFSAMAEHLFRRVFVAAGEAHQTPSVIIVLILSMEIKFARMSIWFVCSHWFRVFFLRHFHEFSIFTSFLKTRGQLYHCLRNFAYIFFYIALKGSE